MISAYIAWDEAWENLKVGESSYRENLKLLADIRERRKQQIALPIDVNKIRLQVLTKEETLVDLRERCTTAANLIEKSIRPDTRKYSPRAPATYDRTLGPFETEFELFKSSRRTFQILDLLEKRSSLQVEKDADDLLPSIDLIAGYRLRGDDYSFGDEENILFAGVAVEFPFTDQVEQAEYQVSRIQMRKRKLMNTNTDDQLYLDTKNLYEEISRERVLLEIARNKITLARAVMKDEKENYSFGKVTLNDYIDAVNIVDNNRFSQVAREARLRRLIVEWLRITDQLITRKDIDTVHGSSTTP